MVGVVRLELTASWSRTKHSYQTELHPDTRLMKGTHYIIRIIFGSVKPFARPAPIFFGGRAPACGNRTASGAIACAAAGSVRPYVFHAPLHKPAARLRGVRIQPDYEHVPFPGLRRNQRTFQRIRRAVRGLHHGDAALKAVDCHLHIYFPFSVSTMNRCPFEVTTMVPSVSVRQTLQPCAFSFSSVSACGCP